MRARWDAKDNPRDYGSAQIMGRDYGIEEPYRGPSDMSSLLTSQEGLILRLHTHDLLIIFPLRKTFLRVIRIKRKLIETLL